jgi:hypothetical protein
MSSVRTGSIQKLAAGTAKRVKFRAKVSIMGDKIHIIIPKSYHKDVEKLKFVNDFVDVELSKEE